jgi:S-adenosylmethionine:tRNA ribosyltransferase-isomerase
MKIKDFDYYLPKQLIAQYPLKKRDESRLLILDRKRQKIHHDKFSHIVDYLPSDSALILNDSKVIPARLFGRREKTAGKVEVLLLDQLEDRYTWRCLIKPLKKININEKIIFDEDGLHARLVNRQDKLLRFNTEDLFDYLDRIGHVPLPPYIKRQDIPQDRESYQTVYAKNRGSVAAPTAGLHFTTELLKKIKKTGIKVGKVTLHVNYATFSPVKVDDIERHKMYYEYFKIEKETIELIKKAKSHDGKIIAVGTTSTRVLETIGNILYRQKHYSYEGKTGIYIYPGYRFQVIDTLITNFHLPRSTLLLLVCAFAGRKLIMKAYNEAIKKKYRFYSYGDAMLIL